jgi:Tfp pilus assembly protein PilW
MGRLREMAAKLRRSEGGFTLIELLVATTMGMVVLGGAVTVFIGAVRSEPRAADRVGSIQEGRVIVERITRELRQGVDVVAATPSTLELVTYVKQASCSGAGASSSSIPCLVTYSCSAGVCTRTVAEPDGSEAGSSVQVVEGLSTDDVFEYSSSEPESDPEFVDVRLSFVSREGGPVVVADGVELRNVEGSSS